MMLLSSTLRTITLRKLIVFLSSVFLTALGPPKVEACIVTGCPCGVFAAVDRCTYPCHHQGTYTAGELINSKELPSPGVGYYHFLGSDPPGVDDWSCLYLQGKIIGVGQSWNRSPRVGIGDLSLECGGLFSPHVAHQNGLEADVRYVRSDGQEAPCSFDAGCPYDQAGTQELINFWIAQGASLILLDSRSGIPQDTVVQWATGHADHFHVRFPKPDTDITCGACV